MVRAALVEGWEVMKRFCQKECSSGGSSCIIRENRLLSECWSQSVDLREKRKCSDTSGIMGDTGS